MTREELIEVMKAGAIAAGTGEPSWADCVTDAEWKAALAALEAAGVRLVPVGEARAQLIDGDERTTVTIFTPYAPPGG